MDNGVELTGFKRAKIGVAKERRRFGLAWLGELSFSKPLLALFVAGVVVTASWQARSMYAIKKANRRPAAKNLFSNRVAASDASRTAPSGAGNTHGAAANSVGLVSGSIDGMTPEQRAKQAADDTAAAAAAKSADDARTNADARPQTQSQSDSNSEGPSQRNSMGGLAGGRFGANSSFNNGGGSFSSGVGLSGGIGGNFSAMNGGMKAPRFAGRATPARANTRASTGNLRAMSGGSARRGGVQGFGGNSGSRSAMGELKTANGMSSAAAGAAGPIEGAAAQTQGAFGESSGGNAGFSHSAAVPSTGGGTGTAPASGGSAPDLTAAQDSTSAAPPGQASSLGPFQGMMDQIAAMADKSASDMKTGKIELIAGMAMLACLVGLFNPALLAAGLALVALGLLTIQKAKSEATQATNMASQLAKQMDNKQQETAVNVCTAEILRTAGAVNSTNCTDPEAGAVGGSSTGINQNETKDTGQIQRVKDVENAAP